MMIDLVQLRTFVVVAEEQHLTRAAERIHISQSAASAHIRAVEETLRSQLFIRTNRSLELTQAGQLLLRKAKTLLSEATQFTSFAHELHGEVAGNLAIGSSGDPFASRVGEVVAAMRAKHPVVHVSLHSRPSSGTRHGLKIGELDIGVSLDKPTDPSIQYYELDSVRFRIAGPVAWRSRIESADVQALAALPWITPQDNSMAFANILVQMFADKGLELNSVVGFDNAVIARALAQAGVGMTLIREEQALQGERDGYLALSPLVCPEYSMWFTHLTTRKNDPLIKAFIEAGRKIWPGLKRAELES